MKAFLRKTNAIDSRFNLLGLVFVNGLKIVQVLFDIFTNDLDLQKAYCDESDTLFESTEHSMFLAASILKRRLSHIQADQTMWSPINMKIITSAIF